MRGCGIQCDVQAADIPEEQSNQEELNSKTRLVLPWTIDAVHTLGLVSHRLRVQDWENRVTSIDPPYQSLRPLLRSAIDASLS